MSKSNYRHKPKKEIMSENSLTNLLSMKNLLDTNNYDDLENLIKKHEEISKNELNMFFPQVIQKYSPSDRYYQLILSFLSNGVDINIPIKYSNNQIKIEEKDNINLLMFSIIKNDTKLLNIVLQNNPKINNFDSFKRNALILAILYDQNDNPYIINLLIINNININYKTSLQNENGTYEDHTAFTLACSKGLTNIVKLLIDNYCNVNFQSMPSKNTGLHYAVINKNVNLIKLILANKNFSNLNLEIKNIDNLRAIDIAYSQQNIYDLFITKEENNNVIVSNSNENKKVFKSKNDNDSPIKRKSLKKNKVINSSNSIDHILSESNGISINIDSNANVMNSNIINNNNINNINNNCNLKNYHNINNENKKIFDQNMKNIILKHKIKSLKNSLVNDEEKQQYEKITYDLDIPIEISNEKTNMNYNNLYLSNFIRESNMNSSSKPTLNFDLTDNTLKFELEYNKLAKEIENNNEILKSLQDKISMCDSKINELDNKLNEKEKKLNEFEKLDKTNISTIVKLENAKGDLIIKYQTKNKSQNSQSKKNILPIDYIKLKFDPVENSEEYISKLLQKDLIDYRTYIKYEMSKQMPVVNKLVNLIKESLNELSPSFELNVYGSYATGLCLTWSDINLLVTDKNEEDFQKTPMNHIFKIKQIYNHLLNKKWINSINLSEGSSFALIKIECKKEFMNLNVDIQYQESNYFGLKCVKLIQTYLNEYSILEPIALALKTLLKYANLNDPKTGGLNSYGLILMIVSYIQSKLEEESFKEIENFAGKIFFGFLYHYGLILDYNQFVVLTYPIRDLNDDIIDKSENLNISNDLHSLIIVDPLNKQNNVASSTNEYMNLKMAFMIAYYASKEVCECGCHYGRANYEFDPHETEHCVLRRIFNSVRRY